MVGGVGCKSRRSTGILKGEDAKDQRLDEYGIEDFSRITSIDKEIVDNYETMSHVNIDFSPNSVYEYKYPMNKIYPVSNSTLSIGESLNVSLVDGKPTFTKTSTGYVATNKSCGTNLTEYFGKEYYEKTGHKVVIVHVANGGGEQIAHFLPHDRVLVESLQDDEVDNNTMHYNSAALSQIGIESALNAAKKVRIKVTFHKNDGTTSNASQEFITDENNRFGYKTDGTVRWKQTGQFGGWNRKGYKLLGWNIDPNEKEAIWSKYSKVSDNWIFEYGPSVDLHAIWQKE